jgi:hypothetical protein
VVEVYRDPVPDALTPCGWRYQAVERLAPGSVVSPLALPSGRMAVRDLVP